MLVDAALGVPHSRVTTSMVAANLVVVDVHVFPNERTFECNVFSSEERTCECNAFSSTFCEERLSIGGIL